MGRITRPYFLLTVPELPEVETVRRGLNQTTLHQPIEDTVVHLERTVGHPSAIAAFGAGLRGKAIAHWHRRGKYLLAELSQPSATHDPESGELNPGEQGAMAGGWLGVHLRMTGQLLWLHPSEPIQTHCRVRLLFNHQKELRFVDQRTFGRMWWIPPTSTPESIITGLQRLGPEPFSDSFSPEYLKQALGHRHRPIKNALLDQGIVAGIGNIYADESLFLSQIHPTTWCDRLDDPALEKLHHHIIQVLHASIMEGGTTFSDFRDIKGINGNYGQMAWVYGLTGQPCRVCGTLIERLKLAGRSTHFCPRCQAA
ncbi:MAG: DNA-formamidopyrimidine glycosylase [Leptolyngbyaceae bacterium]|nr:DNA-formamidopyrimidine glycosylase [Leptolyngbyaceae bacterium]